MSNCSAIKKDKTHCTNKGKFTYNGNLFCGIHAKIFNSSVEELSTTLDQQMTLHTSGKKIIGNLALFNSSDPQLWEEVYQQIMDPKYKKGIRNYSNVIHGKTWNYDGLPPIYLVPRIRGESYKSTPLVGLENNEDAYYAPISKGYSMGDVSSFTLGPIVGSGLCLVNAAFSKQITIAHIEGGGKYNPKRKNFWQTNKKASRSIQIFDENSLIIDGELVEINTWLKLNEHLWLSEWLLWSQSVALCSVGDFHWSDDSSVIAYRYNENYLNFVQWKKMTYIQPAYQLLSNNKVFHHLHTILNHYRRPLALVHPKAAENVVIPMTKEYIREIYDSPYIMCCMPYVVAGLLLGVEI